MRNIFIFKNHTPVKKIISIKHKDKNEINESLVLVMQSSSLKIFKTLLHIWNHCLTTSIWYMKLRPHQYSLVLKKYFIDNKRATNTSFIFILFYLTILNVNECSKLKAPAICLSSLYNSMWYFPKCSIHSMLIFLIQ